MYSSIFTNWIHLSNQHLKQESESVSTLETEKITLYHNFFGGAMLGLHACVISLVVEQRGHSLFAVLIPLSGVASLVAERRFQGTWASAVAAPGLWSTSWIVVALDAPRYVGSSWPRDWTSDSCTGRRILYTEPPGSPLLLFILWFFGHEACGIFRHFNCVLVWVSLGTSCWGLTAF